MDESTIAEKEPEGPRPLEVSQLAGAFDRLFGLDEGERRHLEACTANALAIEPRRKLIVEGEPCGRLYIIKSGWMVETRQLRDGRRQILTIRLPGDIIGIGCLSYPKALQSTVALTRCTVSPLSREEFEGIQRNFPRLATALFLMTLHESAILHEWEVNLGRRVAIPRVAHLLMELHYRACRRGLADGGQIPFPLTQEDVADCTGLTTAYVNRILQELRRKDLIRIDDRTLTVLDMAALGGVAGFRKDYIAHWQGQGGGC